MGIRESLLNTITSVGSSDFVRIVTSAGASSKATLQNVIKSFETNLGAKSSLTTSDYIRVVGSDNNLYKQSVSDVKSTMGVTTLENRFRYVSSGSFNNLQAYGLYLCQSLSNAPSAVYSSWALTVFGDTTATKQVAYPTAGNGELWIRSYVNSAWSAWTQMPTRAEMDGVSVPITGNTDYVTNTNFYAYAVGNALVISGWFQFKSATAIPATTTLFTLGNSKQFKARYYLPLYSNSSSQPFLFQLECRENTAIARIRDQFTPSTAPTYYYISATVVIK